MKQENKDTVEKIIAKYLNIQIELKILKYYKIKLGENKYSINYTSLDSKFIQFSFVHSFGIPILIINNSKLIVLPSFINCLTEKIQSYQINDNEAKLVSYGKSIKLHLSDKLLVLCDKFSRKIAFGTVKSGIFIPITDVGWYLREEKSF